MARISKGKLRYLRALVRSLRPPNGQYIAKTSGTGFDAGQVIEVSHGRLTNLSDCCSRWVPRFTIADIEKRL